jgi:tryptophanase
LLKSIQTKTKYLKTTIMQQVKFFSGEQIPLELHKVRIVQKLNLVPIERRYDAINDGFFNDYMLSTNDIYLDMLTDSGCNAMSDNQLSAMMRADDAYAGSQSFERFHHGVIDVLGKKLLLPCHQGRAAEHIIAKSFVKPGKRGAVQLPLYDISGTRSGARSYGPRVALRRCYRHLFR